MGSAYVDDHRFWYFPRGSGAGQEITQWVSAPEARDELEALSVELAFTVLRNQLYDPYMTWPGLAPGDIVKVVNHGTEVFSGVILTVGLDGSVTANDLGWYLTKSQVILQVSNAAAEDAIRQMCAKAEIPVGQLPSLPTRITDVWTGATPEAILQDILEICSAETGKQYKRRVKNGALQVTELPTVPMTAYHKPADNLAAFDVTIAKGTVTGSDSMSELYNSVVLTQSGQDAAVLGRGYNRASINRYGLIQLVESLSGDEDSAQARQRIKNLLDQNDRLTVERQVDELWGADEVESGVLLRFEANQFGVSGNQRVISVTHRYGSPHLMSVTVQDPAQGRAAGANDTVEV